MFKAHRRVYHPTLGLRVIKKKKDHARAQVGLSERHVLPESDVVAQTPVGGIHLWRDSPPKLQNYLQANCYR